MRIRPKPPTLVSMWMLDVFCCALGCVTLLWLLNNRVASDEATRATSALSELERTRSNLLAVQSDFEKARIQLNADIDDLKARLAATTAERDEANRKLAVARADIDSLEAKLAKAASDMTSLETVLAKSTADAKALEEVLRKKQKEAADLSAQAAVAMQSADELQKLLRQRERERDELALRAKAAEEQLNDADAKLRALAKNAADAKAEAAAMAKTGDELAATRNRLADLQKQLDDANAHIIDLQGDKKKLADKVDQLRIESENKFAGIAMTGKRVVFLVDMSGSMKLLDDRTLAPGKWAGVVETIARVMRSIPDLEQYQVITFSRRAQYLFGDPGWRTYRGEASVKDTADALLAVEPVGDTNLYDGFDLAFRLKPAGLDTIYLFSDGLPTSGPGLSAVQDRTLTESQRTELLSRHLRQTLLAWNPPGSQRVKINSIGFFYEAPEVGAFLWALSREHDGAFVGMSKP
jgi:predicted  nucleic acid-binding Zn-ribbon protein